jgi:hypothetical protein
VKNEEPKSEDGSAPERGTGQRQDHRAAPPGHTIPDEGRDPELDELEENEEAEDRREG